MKIFREITMALLVSVLAGCSSGLDHTVPDQEPAGAGHKKIVAYYAQWSIYGKNYNVADIPADLITHINYAFARIENGRIASADPWADYQKPFGNEPGDAPYLGNFYQLKLLKERAPHLRTLISVGGWTLSSGFSTVASTAAGRSTFAASCVAFVTQYDFDGVDLDWEYPVSGGIAADASPDDANNYVLLLQELRAQLDAAGQETGKTYLLTVATAAGPSNIANLDLPGMNRQVDWFNLMTYDLHGPWEKTTNHQAPLYANPADPTPYGAVLNIDTTVRLYLDGGVPAEKIIIGVPIYGRGWDGVPAVNNGLFQTGTGPSSVGTWSKGVFDYNDLAENYIASDRANVFWDEAAKASYIYDAASQRFISYESLEAVKAKLDYILAEELGGAMVWELSMDPDETLLGEISGRLP